MSFITAQASHPQNWKNKAIPVPERLTSEKNHFQASPLCCQRPRQTYYYTAISVAISVGALLRDQAVCASSSDSEDLEFKLSWETLSKRLILVLFTVSVKSNYGYYVEVQNGIPFVFLRLH